MEICSGENKPNRNPKTIVSEIKTYKMKKIFLTILALSITSLIFYSCTNENQEKTNITDYKEAKINLYSHLQSFKGKETKHNKISSRTIDGEGFEFTPIEQDSILSNSIAVLNSKGITNSQIISEFGSLTNPEIVPTALAVTRIVDEANAGNFIIDLETGYNYTTDSYVNLNNTNAKQSIFDCAMDALGIPAGLILGTANGTSTAALLKAARKLASRTLGWIGAGIAVYEFGDCMEWW